MPKEGGETVEHGVCNDAASLVYLANQACITPHAWLAQTDQADHPDRMVFDLDPSGDDFDAVRFAARAIRAIPDAMGMPSFVMTTGSRGLHVVVPLDASADFNVARAFARRVAELAAAREPDKLTTAQRKEQHGQRL